MRTEGGVDSQEPSIFEAASSGPLAIEMWYDDEEDRWYLCLSNSALYDSGLQYSHCRGPLAMGADGVPMTLAATHGYSNGQHGTST
jgi:hypothetical protein